MANGIELSILIPTITGRELAFNALYNKLQTQLDNSGIWNEVEIKSECDDRTMSIGNKRQLLLNKCYGEFAVFIDDDDDVPDDYCLTLWKAIKENPGIDSVGFLQQCSFNRSEPVIACLSNRFSGWGEHQLQGFRYVRTPFFPTPIKRDICIQIGYNDMRFGEDHDFAIRLKQSGLIQREHFINKILYYYQYTYAPHEEKYGVKKQTV